MTPEESGRFLNGLSVDFFLLTSWHSAAPPSPPSDPLVGSGSPRYKHQNDHKAISGSCQIGFLSVSLRTEGEKSLMEATNTFYINNRGDKKYFRNSFQYNAVQYTTSSCYKLSYKHVLGLPPFFSPFSTIPLEHGAQIWARFCSSPVLLTAGGGGCVGGTLGDWEGESSRLWSDQQKLVSEGFRRTSCPVCQNQLIQ